MQRLNELSIQEKTNAYQTEHANRGLQQTNAEQAPIMENLQHEAKKWKDLAEDHTERASVAAREVRVREVPAKLPRGSRMADAVQGFRDVSGGFMYLR